MGKLGFLRGFGTIVLEKDKSIETLVVKGNLDVEQVNLKIRELFNRNYREKISYNSTAQSLLITMKFAEKFAFFVFESRIKNSELSQEEKHYLSLICNITNSALEIAVNYDKLLKMNLELQKRNQLLSALYELNRDFSCYLNKEQIINHLRYRLLGQLLVNKFAVYYKNEDKIEKLVSNFDTEFEPKLMENLFSINRTYPIDNNREDEFFNQSINALKGQVSIVAPMIYHNTTRGLLLLGKKYNNQSFNEEDINFIEALGSTVMLAIENYRLVQEEIEKKQIEKEIQLAMEIQLNLLPKEIQSFEKFDIWGFTLPSKIVGGDYFDIIQKDEYTINLAIADVSGKGIPASLLMANVQSGLHSFLILNLSITEIVSYLNRIICKNTTLDKFVTFFICEINMDTMELKYINAGHNPPLLFRKELKDFIFLSDGGIFLGFNEFPNEYKLGSLKLQKNDVLVLYTDGVIECTNNEGKEFGLSNLKNFICAYSKMTAKEICLKLKDTIFEFAGMEGMNDDMSIVVLKVK
ncbi:MAG: SpoIIE family protein phosphatase [Ignavibacteria bacterium]|nr:SpoIIE family protein phosphatase [Ignavibacteria bacterium]